MSNNFFDFNGWLQPNYWDRGNNGILFLAYLKYLKDNDSVRFSDIAPAYDSERGRGYYMANPPEQTEHFSIDNMTGLYALILLLIKKYKKNNDVENLTLAKKHLKELPIFLWNHKPRKGRDIWFHPNGWALFLSIKYPLLKFLLYPLIMLMAYWSIVTAKYDDTTGFNLWYLRLKMLGYNRTLERLDNIILKKHVPKDSVPYYLKPFESGFNWSFSYYFTHRWLWTEDIKSPQWQHPVLLITAKF